MLHLQHLRFQNSIPVKTKTCTVRGRNWVWVNWVAGLIDWGLRFRMGIILGTIPSWFLVFYIRVPGCSQNGYGVCPYLWVQKSNSSNLDRAPKMRDSILLNIWEKFLVTLPSISSQTWVIYTSLILGMDVYRDWPFPGCSFCVFLDMITSFHLFLNIAIFRREKLPNSSEDWIIIFLFLANSKVLRIVNLF